MRRALDKLSEVFDDARKSNTSDQSAQNDNGQDIAGRVVNFVKEKSDAVISAVQEHVTSVADMTGALAKQKLLQTLLTSGTIQSEHIRKALQIGIGYFLQQRGYLYYEPHMYTLREKFPSVGGTTPAHNLPDFDFEAYGLNTFHTLMTAYGITSDVFKQQICDGELKEIVNPSSSGSLLYLTSNSGYLIKTARDYDAKFIEQKFLDAYVQHIINEPGTFLAKLFGAYGYIPYISKQCGILADAFTLRFVIFANIIPPNIDIHEKYDLKGSSYKRDANFTERIKKSATYKDNDFRELHPKGLRIPRNIYYRLKETLIRDVEFLERLNIMDYSLLLTVHNIDNKVKPTITGSLETLIGGLNDVFLMSMKEQRIENKNRNVDQSRALFRLRKPIEAMGFIYEEIPQVDVEYVREFGGIPAINEKGERLLLFLGIIDILQTFDICKAMQRQYQTVENPNVVDERSIVESDFYAKRFKEFIFERVLLPDGDEPVTYQHSLTSNYQQSSFHTMPTSSHTSMYPFLPPYNS